MSFTLTRDEHHVLDWLSKEETSAYGECRGKALDRLLDAGLARTVSTDEVRDHNYDRIALTDAGFALLKEIGPWEPKP